MSEEHSVNPFVNVGVVLKCTMSQWGKIEEYTKQTGASVVFVLKTPRSQKIKIEKENEENGGRNQ